jgi:hypothetical protein
MSNLPEMKPVQSSMVQEYGYDAQAQMLYVRFAGGALYRYSEVSLFEFDNLVAAESFGKHLNANIKPNFQAERLT